MTIGAVTVLAVAAVAGRGWDTLGWGAVVAWFGFCAVSNVLPVPASPNVYLSMSGPVNVAVAYLFDPATAATLVSVASVSEWEVRRQTTPLHAAFNRAQLGISAGTAALVLDGGEPGELSWLVRAVAGVLTYQAVNWLLVAVAERTARGTSVPTVLRRLMPPSPPAALIYLALGLMGLALALASVRIGIWSVALLMLPLLGARHAVKVSGDLERAERERRSLADRLVGERERERIRIASHIHDVVLQRLVAVQLQADNVGAALAHDEPSRAAELAQAVHHAAEAAIGDLRTAISDLRRTALDDDGLGPTIERFARTFSRQSGLIIDTAVVVDDVDVPTPIGLLLYEACQELLTNVARHAGAMRAEVSLRCHDGTVVLRVVDDGSGMDAVVASRTDAFGLRLLRERIAFAGGSVFVSAPPTGGTDVAVHVPLPGEAA